MKKILSIGAIGGALASVFAGFVMAASAVVYNNIPDPIPGNVPSVGYAATSTFEFGGQVQLAGTERYSPVVTVLMSSWGCESGTWVGKNCLTTPGATFSHPITLNVYNVGAGNAVGSLITSKTETFTMPYRPSADGATCTGANEGKWHDGTTCVNGKAFPISFDLAGTSLPDKVIVAVAYNTSHYGAEPIGTGAACYSTPQGCGYDSLNVGTNPAPSVGTPLPTSNDAYLDSTWGGAYCDNGSDGTGTFRLDAGCWTGYLPAIKISAVLPPPTSKDQCMKDEWKTFGEPAFKNQGDCVSYVQSNENATGNKDK